MSQEFRYKLEVNINIVKEVNYNPDQQGSYWQPSQERLTVSESLDLGALNFMGVMGVLGELHGAVEQIKESQGEGGKSGNHE